MSSSNENNDGSTSATGSIVVNVPPKPKTLPKPKPRASGKAHGKQTSKGNYKKNAV